MESTRLLYLLERYHSGACSAGELSELENWYEELSVPLTSGEKDKDGLPGLAEEMFIDFEKRLAEKQSASAGRVFRLRVLRIAAAVIGLLFTGGLSYYFLQQPAGKVISPRETVFAYQNRFIMLPDGSKVVLRGNSTLVYPKIFDKQIRQVELTGEAYFDVQHDQKKPFIIHSGKLTTTVLGTAFNIQAYTGQENMSVTVTRGKVEVKDQRKVLSVLTPNKELTYHVKAEMGNESTVEADNVIAWTRQDMIFESVSFKDIAARLNKRYQVEIRIENQKLENCPVTASFKGTETIQQVLDVICSARNVNYLIKNKKQIIIKGKGC